MGKLTGKVAVVTGASKGIGAAIANALGAEGATVVVNYARAKADADRIVGEIKAKGGKAQAIQADVSKKEDVERLFAETKDSFGHIDVLVNNAGVYEFAPLEQIDGEQFSRLFNTNVLGLLLATKAGVAAMNGNGGSVINVSSVVALSPPAYAAVYSATKGAVDAISKSLAQELGARNIRVNSINPGLTETEGFHASEAITDDFKNGAISRTPLGRIGQPQDIAKAAVFLASDDSSWITGEVIPVSGGLRP
jgi:3-oxoacyl-[acyl-carrier protein] reductase